MNAPEGNLVPTLLDFDFDADRAGEYLRSSIQMLTQYKLSPNPVNFWVCYEYQSARSQAFRDAVDNLVENDASNLNNATARALFTTHLWGQNLETLGRLESELQKCTLRALRDVSKASENSRRSSDTLNGYAATLETLDAVEEIRAIVLHVMDETKSFAESSRNLAHTLNETRQQVEDLRVELEETREAATKDSLTGLLNKGAFESELVQAMDVAKQNSEPLCLLLIDVDRFKRVNDTFGHLVGDKVIKTVAELLSSNLKGKDKIARLGGDEFAVLLPDTPPAASHAVGEVLRNKVQTTRFRRARTKESLGEITVSVGATYYKPGEDADAFLQRADDALYQAKNQNRNTVATLFD